MKTFDGFPPGKARMIEVPVSFFSDLLPLIDDLAELKVTLFCWCALYQKEGEFRYLRRRDFANDPALMRGLAIIDPASPPEDILDTALRRAVERGTLLYGEISIDTGLEQLYFVNTALGRTGLKQLLAGNWKPGDSANPIEILPERPSIFQMYEANIGALTPIISDEIKDALRDYPEDWLEEAIRIAAVQNVRRWRYIRAILQGWSKEGKTHEIHKQHREQPEQQRLTGKTSDFIER